jgi:3,5-epimerase/4-reductase
MYYNSIDFLEQKGTLMSNIRDNLYSPVVLALLSNKYNIHYTYLGTGCIFEYDEDHPYETEINGFTEESYPNFFGSSYSIMKGYIDRLMNLFNNVLNVTSYKKICSISNSMTVLPELLPIMIDMALNKINGTINLVNPGLISHNEILEIYKEIVDPNFK